MTKPDYKAFAMELLSEWPESLGIDGFGLQDLAEAHGLLIPETKTKFCPETYADGSERYCSCREYIDLGVNESFICYKRAWIIKQEDDK